MFEIVYLRDFHLYIGKFKEKHEQSIVINVRDRDREVPNTGHGCPIFGTSLPPPAPVKGIDVYTK